MTITYDSKNEITTRSKPNHQLHFIIFEFFFLR